MSPANELEPLLRLRRQRADRAERLLQNALRDQRNLGLRIEQARQEVELARAHESQQRAALLARYQEQVLPLRVLSGWDEEERNASARTARQVSVLQSLLEQQRLASIHIERARLDTCACQRKVEGLGELAVLLAEEGQWPGYQD